MLFTIIIPIYNSEKYLKYCLDKVINQSYKKIEIICVNDGSTDSSLQIINEYAQKDSRFKIINQKHSGVSKARNNGLQIASGQYISFIDSDDIISTNLYEKIHKIIEKNTPDVIIFNGVFYNQKTRKLKNKKFIDTLNIKNYIDENTNHTYKDFKNFFLWQDSVAIKIYKHSFIKENKFSFNEKTIFEDKLFNTITLLSAKSISILDEYLYLYRQNVYNSTNFRIYEHNSTLLLNIFYTLNELENYVIKNFPELKNEFYNYIIEILVYYFFYCPIKLKKIYYLKMKSKLSNTINDNFFIDKKNNETKKIYYYIKNNNYLQFYLYLLFRKLINNNLNKLF